MEGYFPVLFYNGKREINMGTVRVNSSLNFKTFQLGLSRRIGISPNQITVYLVDRRTLPDPGHKIPITSKSNFSLLVRETDCHFLVVLKPPRKVRRAAAREKLLLRRSEAEFAERWRELHSTNSPAGPLFPPGLGAFPTIRESLSCRECEIARRQGKTVEFHHCICNPIVAGFRPAARPIAPPREHC